MWSKVLAGRGFNGDLAFDGAHVAIGIGSRLSILDRHGEISGNFVDFSSRLGSPPVADGMGNFLFATSSLWSIRPDGTERWRFQLGPNLDWSKDATYVLSLVLSPAGITYFAASDGYFYAVDSSTGRELWRRSVGLSPHKTSRVAHLGVGDVVFLDGEPFDVRTGIGTAGMKVQGDGVWPIMATYGGFIAVKVVVGASGFYEYRTYVMDKCGKLKWSLPEDGSADVDAVGQDEVIWYRRKVPEQADLTSIYSESGALLAGPEALKGRATSIGADGVVYGFGCDGLVDAGNMNVVAYSVDEGKFQEKWSLNLGAPCTFSGSALGEDGVLYFARASYEHGVEVLAVQTSSPGLARTSWPTFGQNNSRSLWLQ